MRHRWIFGWMVMLACPWLGSALRAGAAPPPLWAPDSWRLPPAPAPVAFSPEAFAQDVPVCLPAERGFTAAQGGWFAAADKRQFYALDWTAGGRWQGRYAAWLGYQTITALGRSVGNHFRTTATRLGGAVRLRGTAADGLSLVYHGYRSGTGEVYFDNAGAPPRLGRTITWADLEGPTSHALSLCRVRPSGDGAAWVKAGYGAARLGNRASDALGFGVGITRPLASNLEGVAEAVGFYEQARGLTYRGDEHLKAQLRAGIFWHPARWIALQVNAEYFPTAMPFAGTPLTGLSSFNLYEPDTLIVTRMRSRHLLFANARVVLNARW
ncbi:MAG: hypothetical protein HY321_14805 [Armatimonadetes bacterium]|nr:hypothetical protein [Armatimonadota bacterium]